MATLKVLVVYPFMHHYRAGVFRVMDETPGIDYTFASDVKPQHGIEALSPSVVKRHVRTRYRRWGKLSWQTKTVGLVTRRRWDAVIFLGDPTSISTWIGALLLRVWSVPVLFWTIGWHRPDAGPKRLLRQAFYRTSNRLLLYGEIAREIGREQGFPDDRMAVIGNSVEPPRDHDAREEWNFVKHHGTVVLGAVIRLSAVKRLDLLIEAASRLKSAEFPRVVVLLVGDGPERARLAELASERGVELVMPGPRYSGSTLAQVYEALDVTVVPSAVGLTAIQSMSHGVPVISDDAKYSQMPEWEAIRPGVTGELFSEGNVAELAEAIRRVVTSSQMQRAAYARHCQDEVRVRWTPEAQAGRIAEATRNAVDRAHGRRSDEPEEGTRNSRRGPARGSARKGRRYGLR